MFVLGINGGFRPGYQDISACLLRDGQVIGAVEEERLNRIKHAPGMLPSKAVQWLLNKEGISLADIDLVATHGESFGPGFESLLKAWFRFRWGHSPPVLRVHHHLAHAAGAYYGSGFDEAMILTVDNSGDGLSAQTAVGSKGKIELLRQYKRPQSLGLFYSMMTQFCGFQRDRDEYKLMGLSAYGQPDYDLSFVLKVGSGSYKLNEDYLVEIKQGQSQPHIELPLFSDRLAKALRLQPRLPHQPLSKQHKNLASSCQFQLEKALVEIVTELYRRTNKTKLCLSGGVALNCLANQKLAELDFIEDIYVQPSSSDAGISLGAGWLAGLELGKEPVAPGHTCFGPSYTDGEIFKELKACGIPFKKLDNISAGAAQEILKGKIIGWFQGAMEFGPRALGCRSVLADVFDPGMKDKINQKVKFREAFRPFGPSVLAEDKEAILDSPLKDLPYMTVTAHMRESCIKKLPAVAHADGTTRPQTVGKEGNPLYYRLLQEIKKQKGLGALLNTSFNRNHEPIVCSPKEALACFYGCGMDSLIIGSFLVEKRLYF